MLRLPIPRSIELGSGIRVECLSDSFALTTPTDADTVLEIPVWYGLLVGRYHDTHHLPEEGDVKKAPEQRLCKGRNSFTRRHGAGAQ